ncbi:WXG100 family type VII secretion target [Nocardia sp. NPDC052566]|uniref:WXG100 family type VII secretion target n=1 Tax=Nocardia sp. NPDC052566 TaxID=3364330 RepID=UPI0037CA69C5
MAGALHLDFPTFQKYANEYAATIPPIDKTVDKLGDAVQAAKSGWEGDANAAFNRFADELQKKILAVNKDLGLVSDALNTGEKKVASAEDESMSGFTSLNTNYL